MRDQKNNLAARALLKLWLSVSALSSVALLCFGQTNLAPTSAAGGSAFPKTNTMVVPRETVILTPQQAANPLWNSVEHFPLWTPSREAVCAALTRLPGYLRGLTNGVAGAWGTGSTVAGVQSGMATTFCQAVGVTFKGRQCVLLSCLPSPGAISSGWKERYIRAEDGGPGFWRVIYVSDEQRFTRLQLNGGY
jgi:hypothetical protein